MTTNHTFQNIQHSIRALVEELQATFKAEHAQCCAAEARVAELEAALAAVYAKYVVDLHGERVCDCDTYVEGCAPCLARAALAKEQT